MKYFMKPKSIEDLKEQYRKLLIKYDYRSGKNAAILKEIEAEYSQLFNQVAKEEFRNKPVIKAITNSYDEIKEEINSKKQSRANMENARYSKEYLNQYINEIKKFIGSCLVDIVKDYSNLYLLKVATYNENNPAVILNRFDDNVYVCNFNRSVRISDKWTEIILKLECIVYSMSGHNESDTEEMLRIVDKQLAEYIKNVLPQYEAKYADPIDAHDLPESKIAKGKRTFKLYYRAKQFVGSVVVGFVGLTSGVIGLALIQDTLFISIFFLIMALYHFICSFLTLIAKVGRKRQRNRGKAALNKSIFMLGRFIIRALGFSC